MKKIERQNIIRELIKNRSVGNQDELQSYLIRMGVEVNRSTLSRDLKEMQVAKIANVDSKYKYILPNISVNAPLVSAGSSYVGNLVKSIKRSGNMVVVKTNPGYANGLASDIDSAQIDEIIGTIAGDDTILIILGESTEAKVEDLLQKAWSKDDL
ncbi:MAG: arginine repressor [Bacteroidales bacterium]